MAAHAGERFRAVAIGIDGAVGQVDAQLGGIDLEVLALHLPVHVQKLVALLDVELLHSIGLKDGGGVLDDVVGDGLPGEPGENLPNLGFVCKRHEVKNSL